MKKPVYRLLYKNSVKKDLRKLPDSIRVQIAERIRSLINDPYAYGAAKLHGSLSLYRVRHGDYRIIYEINNGELIIIIIKVGHRKEIYRDLK